MKAAKYLLLLLLCVSLEAFAITGLEFLKLENEGKEKPVLDAIIIHYVELNYKNVPSWAKLSARCKELVLKNGWGAKSLDDIATEAAITLGMSK